MRELETRLSETAPAPAAAATKPRSTGGRLDAVDWLRGLAVVLMIQTHLYDAWVSDAARHGEAWWWSRYLGGVPSRLFLLLVGVSMAIKFESQSARGVERSAMVRGAMRRGLEIVVLAYLFRLQEYILGGWGPNWIDLFRIDILNCIGASMLVAAPIAAPRGGRPQIVACLAAALFFIALGPIVGPAHFPGFLPRPLTSYLGGERPMAWFPLFPWAAWPLIGVVAGHFWVRMSRSPRRQLVAFAASAGVGLLLMAAVTLVRRFHPYIVRYPSYMVQQMGPGTFFYRLGELGLLALLSYAGSWLAGKRFSPMRQLGKTSLLVYWIHVELCYGLVAWRLDIAHNLSMGWATVGFVVMCALMLLVSLLKTKYWPLVRRRRQPQPAPALPAAP